jgi:Rrf2 family protein
MISQKARYAFKALLLLASQPVGASMRIEEIARQGAIPRKFLEQILLELKRDGLIDSRRGRAGGYVLVKAASEIMVGNVLRVVDGPIAPLSCISRTAYRRCADCSEERYCGLRRLFAGAHAAMLEVLDATNLADGVAMLLPEAQQDPAAVEKDPATGEQFFVPDLAKENQLS